MWGEVLPCAMQPPEATLIVPLSQEVEVGHRWACQQSLALTIDFLRTLLRMLFLLGNATK